jgi:hypothetical protein
MGLGDRRVAMKRRAFWFAPRPSPRRTAVQWTTGGAGRRGEAGDVRHDGGGGLRQLGQQREIADHAALALVDDQRRVRGGEELDQVDGHALTVP